MDVKTYIDNIPEERKKRFLSIIATIKKLYPDAEESMKYKMPTYIYNDNWIAAASQKQYISVYTCSAEHLKQFKSEHPGVKTGKGCINFQDKDEIPIKDLERVIVNAIESVKY